MTLHSASGDQRALFPQSVEPSEVPAVDDSICCGKRKRETAHVRLQCPVETEKIQADGRCRPAPTFQP